MRWISQATLHQASGGFSLIHGKTIRPWNDSFSNLDWKIQNYKIVYENWELGSKIKFKRDKVALFWFVDKEHKKAFSHNTGLDFSDFTKNMSISHFSRQNWQVIFEVFTSSHIFKDDDFVGILSQEKLYFKRNWFLLQTDFVFGTEDSVQSKKLFVFLLEIIDGR